MKNHFFGSRVYKVISVGAFVSACFVLNGCDRTESKKEDPLPTAASSLMSDADGSGAEMPHKLDSATEFPEAMASLASSSTKPQLRDTGMVGNVVRVEKAPSITKPGASVTAQKAIEKDWDGLVLIPDGTQMSHAHTTDVEFGRIEAHPLTDGSLRVWVRIQNVTDKNLKTRVACNFKSPSVEAMKTAFVPVEIAPHEGIDVYFMSPITNVVNYTILVR